MLTDKKSKILVILVILGLLVALLPTSLAAAKCDKSYEVKRGDTLTNIGEDYGYAANQIVNVNKWKKPYTIYVGQRICIPTSVAKGVDTLESKYANKLAAYFTAGRTPDSVLIYTHTYPSTTVLIKGTNTSDSSRTFYKIGTLAIKNDKTYKFKLPSDLKNVKNLQICLKDRTTGYLQCVKPR